MNQRAGPRLCPRGGGDGGGGGGGVRNFSLSSNGTWTAVTSLTRARSRYPEIE